MKERTRKLREKLDETKHDFHLSADHIYKSVETGLVLAQKSPLVPVKLAGAPEGSVFRMPALDGAWARCGEGLDHPHTKQIRPITFDHAVAQGRDDVVLVHLNHRLVQMCLRLLRAEVWAGDDVKRLHRVATRRLPDDILSDIAVVVVSRLVVTGGNHHRLHEELTVAGGFLKDKSFTREPRVTEVQGWLDKATPFEPSDSLFSALKKRFESQEAAVHQSVEARSKDRLKHLRNTLETRKRKETDNISEVLDDLAKSIGSELEKENEPKNRDWIEELSPDERTQVKRDYDALKARLARIPEEKEKELAAIERRYAGFVDRTFPVAVVFLIPESKTGSR